ncbi:MAG TPA: sigma-70 family RNA polymerase sigma factor [Candidatus Saccharimonadales bacterium]|nr:sigma-70 family RNA polymerase sigma factor [Candidatus Saccharimonadales bacterium]
MVENGASHLVGEVTAPIPALGGQVLHGAFAGTPYAEAAASGGQELATQVLWAAANLSHARASAAAPVHAEVTACVQGVAYGWTSSRIARNMRGTDAEERVMRQVGLLTRELRSSVGGLLAATPDAGIDTLVASMQAEAVALMEKTPYPRAGPRGQLHLAISFLADNANPYPGRWRDPAAAKRQALLHHMSDTNAAPPAVLPSPALTRVLDDLRRRYDQCVAKNGWPTDSEAYGVMAALLGIGGRQVQSFRELQGLAPHDAERLREVYSAHLAEVAAEFRLMPPAEPPPKPERRRGRPPANRTAVAAGVVAVDGASTIIKPQLTAEPAAPPAAKRAAQPATRPAAAKTVTKAAAPKADTAAETPAPAKPKAARKAPPTKTLAVEAGAQNDAVFAEDDLMAAEAEAAAAGADTDEDDSKAQTDQAMSADGVRAYLNRIRHSILTREEEVQLAKEIEAGLYAAHLLNSPDGVVPELLADYLYIVQAGERAKDALLRQNLRLAVFIAKRYTGRGMEYLDLIQEGNLGLIRAVEKFNYVKGYKFSTYATWWIRQAIIRALDDQARTIRIPVHVGDEIKGLRRDRKDLTAALGRDPEDDELAAHMGISLVHVHELYGYMRPVDSLDAPVKEGESKTLGDLVADVADTGASGELGDIVRAETEAKVLEILEPLPERWRTVLLMRWGLYTGTPMTQQDIAEVLGRSNKRIAQIEATAKKRLAAIGRLDELYRYLKGEA